MTGDSRDGALCHGGIIFHRYEDATLTHLAVPWPPAREVPIDPPQSIAVFTIDNDFDPPVFKG